MTFTFCILLNAYSEPEWMVIYYNDAHFNSSHTINPHVIITIDKFWCHKGYAMKYILLVIQQGGPIHEHNAISIIY